MRRAIGSITTVIAIMLLSGCGPASVDTATSDAPSPTSSSDTVSSPSTPAEVTTPKTVAVPSVPPVPVVSKPIPAHTTVGITINSAGAILPNHARTPGAINPDVTQANIGTTICVSGWTATLRPSSPVTTRIKVAQLASGYAYRGDTAKGDYEEDHLISLELGGAPDAEANLWPEPYNAPDGARVKDVIENRLHTLVCSDTISLATAQRVIASNWWTGYQTYVGTAPAQSNSNRAPAPKPAPGPAPVTSGGGATGLCNDGSYSYAAHHQGACSGHGGVKVFYK